MSTHFQKTEIRRKSANCLNKAEELITSMLSERASMTGELVASEPVGLQNPCKTQFSEASDMLKGPRDMVKNP